MGWLDNQCRVCSAPGAADRDYLLIRPYETGIGSHQNYLASYLGALPEDPQGLSYKLIHLIGIELAANCPTYPAEGMSGRQN